MSSVYILRMIITIFTILNLQLMLKLQIIGFLYRVILENIDPTNLYWAYGEEGYNVNFGDF